MKSSAPVSSTRGPVRASEFSFRIVHAAFTSDILFHTDIWAGTSQLCCGIPVEESEPKCIFSIVSRRSAWVAA